MGSICGANCAECPAQLTCPGCAETEGCPFGKQCYVAKYITTGGMDAYREFKRKLIEEINALNIDGMEAVAELYPLVGNFVNLEYRLPSGEKVKFLKDDEVYLGTQTANLLDEDKKMCFGAIAREDFLLICAYGENCADPEIVIYKRR